MAQSQQDGHRSQSSFASASSEYKNNLYLPKMVLKHCLKTRLKARILEWNILCIEILLCATINRAMPFPPRRLGEEVGEEREPFWPKMFFA